MEFYIFDDKSKNMLSVMYSPNHTKFTFKNVSSLADSGDPNEFDWEKLQTENSLIGESAQKKQPRSENGRLIPKFSFHKNSETEAEEKNKEVNILSIVKMMGNRGPLTKGSKFHFEDKADTIQFLHGKDNVFQKVIKEEDEGSQKSTIRSVDNSGLVENIKLNNQISFIMDHKKILNSMESRYRDMEQKGHARKLWFNDPNTESESSHTDSINLKNNFSSSLNVSQFTFWFGNANWQSNLKPLKLPKIVQVDSEIKKYPKKASVFKSKYPMGQLIKRKDESGRIDLSKDWEGWINL